MAAPLSPVPSDNQPPSVSVGSDGQKIWRVGTLTYNKAGLTAVFAWLLWGDFAWMIKERALWPLVPIILKNFNASGMITGLFMGTLPAALGLVLGPIVSYRSDRLRSARGRRIPYLLLSTPFAAAGIIGCAFSAHMGEWLHNLMGADSPGVKTASLICFGVWWVLFEIGTVITNAIFYALINDVVPNPLLGRFFGLFRAISLFAGIIFNLFLIETAKIHYVEAFVMIGILYGAGFMLMCYKVKEGDYPPPEATVGKTSIIEATKTYFRESFRLPYYWWVFAAVTLGMAVFIPVNMFSVLHSESLGISIKLYGIYVAITFAISICLAYPLGALADRFHPTRMALVTLSLYAILTTWAGFSTQTREGFAIAFIGHGVVSGMFFTCAASIQQRLFPRERFAQFASAAGILTGVANMIIAPVVGQMLDLTNDNYSNTYFAGLVICITAIIAYAVTYRHFMKLGGPKSYVAPL